MADLKRGVEIDLIHKGIKTFLAQLLPFDCGQSDAVEIDLIHKGIKT